MLTLLDHYKKKVIPAMKEHFHYGNVMEVPRFEKAVINVGIGRVQDRKERESIKHMLSLITGQMPQERPTNKSIASFKIRAGAIVGYRIMLRGRRMYEFLSKLIFASIPRTRDFRGIPLSNIDESGNLNLGIREHIIFPETIGEDISKIFSLQITVVTNAKTREEAIELFRQFGFPLQKEGQEK
ncbi:MAG: 50S ribosomal protein L5 [Candidatus Ryanbacteria bacterium RIFCSPHIGHO2_02_FULL_45_43]|uniref:Large ribosomal subunit protein uL5 n=1 Tax=Candidatus Ryanbacteria bacterium RIFCSPHIGHO2_01_45_13 TaxID=1802112 RepID=A0A1G2FXL3_9BACT|nr:MAG: 50S ribosomal protein L5 [Candidatus Ryanbacteria bacterium RIFCSPHIGHO2_01_FULL_44_130]OGZ42462.1 MAG: 50S ribosomal protein L5 [Candidatus Ryanbacteria bacterium RIFCSPHIGHO2_01_45_13]OGZ48479.1 MAG: 50S ribosomal protein L5 [Candidatus Ryanbacteria bacterium RIFCSPHIGHO2_02_FULL_45_43]OGZ50343.1 MAG: 50S ribosomal protein L5 [Candidatus Ryanbacteria bacterium RIFCSPHIGHO2_12_FULL_44_20]OGZ51683.1 MAG: 50S ribosomal protein L5 [Candidatus Ryanbacteria bacterium RIFCSPLOWO2_01_FULL_44_